MRYQSIDGSGCPPIGQAQPRDNAEPGRLQRTICIRLTAQQMTWLDEQTANGCLTRTALLRLLVQEAMIAAAGTKQPV